MTPADYDDLWKRQGGKCPICERPLDPSQTVVDHDHATLAVRGLLCNGCNGWVRGVYEDLDFVRRLLEREEDSDGRPWLTENLLNSKSQEELHEDWARLLPVIDEHLGTCDVCRGAITKPTFVKRSKKRSGYLSDALCFRWREGDEVRLLLHGRCLYDMRFMRKDGRPHFLAHLRQLLVYLERPPAHPGRSEKPGLARAETEGQG